ncbi:HAD family hydrolase [Dokdonella sp.]|uniref:HAD family hydrolase n=1 Tax=Dokdonella sp. TaxID=2291710 RepID=UPI001AFE059D|nr:HAD family hydrolase [Dokdonella sp.]MBO9662230.1 HAD family hydrolase [Dokdonella sp.]
MRILALSLDLDDTLWPVAPAIQQAERALDDWLRRHHAAVAERWPIAALRELRDQVSAERPDLAHDFTTQRLLTLQRAFAACGFGDEHVDAAFEAYFEARNRVQCYADVEPALAALAARVPLVSLSNGNADLERIGLRRHFAHCISAREFGAAKPDAAIFHAACARLGLAPEHVLHVGDDAHLDVVGAHRAGLRTAWINRHASAWTHADVEPDLHLRDLGELVHWLERRAA